MLRRALPKPPSEKDSTDHAMRLEVIADFDTRLLAGVCGRYNEVTPLLHRLTTARPSNDPPVNGADERTSYD